MDILINIGSALLVLVMTLTGIDARIRSRGWKGEKSDHFDGTHFYNMGWTKKQTLRLEQEDKKTGYIYGFLRFIFARKTYKWKKKEIMPIQVSPYNSDDFFRITFIGHATFLIQIAGINILTDPVYSYRASPCSFLGPKRYNDPGIRFEDLPPIDVILLSHNHYDHMDIPTLQKIQTTKGAPCIYTGLGNSDYLNKKNISNALDLDWWDTELYTKKGVNLTITYVPAQHFSARGISDRNKTLWGGFTLHIAGKSLYFAGDTAYGPCIDAIAEKFSQGFDIGLLPIGAYKPRWFLSKIHADPKEGLLIQEKLQIQTGIAMHWGVFPLADDGQYEAIEYLANLQKKPEFAQFDFRAEQSGASWDFDTK